MKWTVNKLDCVNETPRPMINPPHSSPPIHLIMSVLMRRNAAYAGPGPVPSPFTATGTSKSGRVAGPGREHCLIPKGEKERGNRGHSCTPYLYFSPFFPWMLGSSQHPFCGCGHLGQGGAESSLWAFAVYGKKFLVVLGSLVMHGRLIQYSKNRSMFHGPLAWVWFSNFFHCEAVSLNPHS